VIVIVGAVAARMVDGAGSEVGATGLAAGIAMAAAAAGARVEIVTRLGEDPTGDAVMLAFAGAGVGHVATLRDAAHVTPLETRPQASAAVDTADDLDDPDDPDADVARAATSGDAARPTLDAADVGLALRYLTDYRVLVAVHPADPGIVAELAAASDWASAHLIVVTPPGESPLAGVPAEAVLIAAPDDAEGVAGLLGRYAAAVDAGGDPATAFTTTFGAAGAAAT
jgi:2-dehydro-3-deoxygluconokinase